MPRCVLRGERPSGASNLDDLLDDIDRRSSEFRSRSEFLETAAPSFLRQLARRELEQRDLRIVNSRADALNAEAEDVLSYQVRL